MKGKKKIWVMVILGVILIGWAWSRSNSNDEALEITAEKSSLRDIVETVTANGNVQPETEVKISPDVSGEIVELTVKEGGIVKKGDLLARINPDIYISVRSRAEASLNNAKANVENAASRVTQAVARLALEEKNHERSKKLHSSQAISDSEMETVASSFAVSKAEMTAAEQTLKAAEFSVKSAEASLSEATNNLDKTTIYSPVDGTVSMLNVELGERVVGTSQMAGTEMMRIADLNVMEVSVEVNENDIVKVKLLDDVKIDVDAWPGELFDGKVTEIGSSATSQGLTSDQVTTFNVKIRVMESKSSKLKPGMSATVDIRTDKVTQVVSVPIQSVTTREDTIVDETGNNPVYEVVFVMVEGKAMERKVKTGLQNTKYIEVLSGVNDLEEVISGPYSVVSRDLKEGDLVTVLKEGEDRKKRRKSH